MTKCFLAVLALAVFTTPLTNHSGSAQGRCMTTFGAPTCVTREIAAVFAPTLWKTTALEQITFRVADYKKEAAFYAALMGWTLRSDDGKQAVMDIGSWGTVIFKQVPAASFEAPPAGGRGDRTPAVIRMTKATGSPMTFTPRPSRAITRRHRTDTTCRSVT